MNTAFKSNHTRLAALVAGAISVLTIALGIQVSAQAVDTTGTATSTVPAIGGVAVTRADPFAGTADIRWSTDVPTLSRVYYGLSQGNYTGSSSPESSFSTSHFATISGLSPGVTYHVAVAADNGSGSTGNSTDQAFTMPSQGDGVMDLSRAPSSASASVSSNSVVTSAVSNLAPVTASMSSADVQARISQIQSDLATLQSELNSLEAQFGVSSTATALPTSSTSGTAAATTSASATAGTGRITPNSSTVRTGTSVDFSGSGFWNNEPVTVMSNGQTVATVQADGSGNFSTGSLPVSAAAGTSQTYTFIGSWSGITGSATATVTS